MSESMLGNFSGKIGIPEGAFKRLANKQVESAIEFIVQNQINLTQIITDSQGGGTGNVDWIRASANGTKLAGSATLSCSRTAEGTYLITHSVGYTSSGGNYQYGVVATPSTVSGNGGDGVSPFKALSDYDIADTGDYAAGSKPELQMRVGSDGNIYIPSSTEDRVFKHTLSDFLGTVTQINPSVDIATNGHEGSVMDREGAYLWLGNQAGNNLKVVKISDGSILDFGALAADFRPIGAATISGTYYIVAHHGGTKLYTPNMVTPALGTATTLTASEISNSVREGCWDGNNNLWCTMNSGSLVDMVTQIDVVLASFVQHNYPSDLGGSVSPSSRFLYDALRNELYLGLTDGTTTNNALFRFFGWIDGVADSASWELMLNGLSPDGMYHYTPLDILFIVKWNTTTTPGPRTVIRYHLPSRSIIDSNIINATYSLISNSCYYSDPYGYVIGRTVGGDNYLIRLDYSGAEIDVAGSGSIISSVLHTMYQIISATQFYVYMFRSLSPPIRADGEFTAQVSS